MNFEMLITSAKDDNGDVSMRKFYKLLWIFPVLFACVLLPQNSTFFDNPVCEPPCWETIMPGNTTREEALAVLSKITATNQSVMDNHQSGAGFDDKITFTIHKGQDPYVAGWLYIRNDQIFVISFNFYAPYYAPYAGIRLDHAIQLFGEPESISLIQSSRMDLVTLLNPEKGIALGYALNGDSRLDSASIEPAIWISGVMFFDPNQFQTISDSDIVLGGTFNPNNFHPWVGYGSFKDKYWPPATP
jgi:hypothetical protein